MKLKLKANTKVSEEMVFNDLKKFADTYSKFFMWEAMDMIYEFAYKEMLGYYEEYNPRYYSRTYLMQFFSYKKYYSHSNNYYEGGIIIDSSNTCHEEDNDFEWHEEMIYSFVWIKGVHGLHQGKKDRFGRLKKKAFSKGTMTSLDKKSMKVAKTQSYSVIDFK